MDRAFSSRGKWKISLLLLFGLVLALIWPDIPAGVFAQADSPPEDWKLERVRLEIVRLKSALEQAHQDEESLLGELHSMDLDLDLQAKELSLVEAELSRCRRDLSLTQETVGRLRPKLERSRKTLGRRLRSLYVSGPPAFDRVVLGAEEPMELLEAYRLASLLARSDETRLQTYRSDMIRLTEASQALEIQTLELESLRRDRRNRRRGLEKARLRRAQRLDSIRETLQNRETALAEMEQTERALQHLMEGLSGDNASSNPEEVGFESFRRMLPWPVPGTILVPFGVRKNSRYDTEVPHPGLVLEVAVGEPVHSIFDGEVAYSDWFKGYGNLVVIEHGQGFMSVYGHVSERLVSTGDEVDAGQVIARAGDTGSLDGPRLYFEIWSQGKPVNPTEWLEDQTIK